MWRTPALAKEFAPFALHRTYGGPFDDLTCVDWSADGTWLICGGKDLTCRVFSLDPIEGYEPPTLSGHRDRVVAAFWADAEATTAFTVSRVRKCAFARVRHRESVQRNCALARDRGTRPLTRFLPQPETEACH